MNYFLIILYLIFFSHPQESTGGVSPTREQARREAERKVSTYTAVCLYKYLFTFSLLLLHTICILYIYIDATIYQ